MIRVLSIVAVLFAAVLVTVGQENQIYCPKIEVIGPAGITQPGDKMTFAVGSKVSGLGIKYKWTVEDGRIIHGQGTKEITVIGDKPNTHVNAIVSITGLPEGCRQTASGLGAVAPAPTFCPILDEWSKIKPNDERGRLDVFFAELSNSPSQIGIIRFSGVPAANRTIDHPKIRFIAKHAAFREFDASRFVFLFDTEEQEESSFVNVKLYRIPSGSEMPFPTAVLIHGSQVKATEPKTK